MEIPGIHIYNVYPIQDGDDVHCQVHNLQEVRVRQSFHVIVRQCAMG